MHACSVAKLSPTLCDSMNYIQPTRILYPWDFQGKKYWSRLSLPPPRDPPDPGTKSASPVSPALVGRFFTTAPTRKNDPGKPKQIGILLNKVV